jgi:apolipoprotein N-acyltransferase
VIRLKIQFDLLILAVSGACLGFAFAPYPFRFIAYVSLVGLFMIIEKYQPKRVFLLGWFYGFFASLSLFWWIFFLVVPLESWVKGLMYLGVILLCGYLGVYIALFAWATRRLGLWVAPFIWAILEFIRTKSQIAFPWALLGYSQTPYVPLIQFASFTGVYGVSAWVVLINLLVYLTIKNYKKFGIGLAVAFIVPLCFGFLTIKNNHDWMKVAIIQPNVLPNEKGDVHTRGSMFNDLVSLTRTALKDHPDLLVFPETATIVPNQAYQKVLAGLVDSGNAALVTGTPLWEDGPQFEIYNGAVLFLPGKGIVAEYKKMKLVPFSEKVPYSDNLKFLKKVDLGGGDLSFGKEYTVFPLPQGGFSVLICYEAIFPDLTRQFTRRGAQFLVGITNDGWFGRTPAPYHHYEMALMRTVENGVPLARSANNGISLIADSYGRIIKKTGLFQKAVLSGYLPHPKKFTFYRKYGDVFILLSMIIVLVAIGLKIRKERSD